MLKIRPYKVEDANTILSWCNDENAFYQWTAGVLGEFPVTPQKFRFVENLTPFTAFDETGIIGFFTFRNPNGNLDELRFGFVIVDPEKRGKGYGKAMLHLGLRYAFDTYGASKVSLGVFENNISAYHCYKSAGFQEVILESVEEYRVMSEVWKCRELILEKSVFDKDYRLQKICELL